MRVLVFVITCGFFIGCDAVGTDLNSVLPAADLAEVSAADNSDQASSDDSEAKGDVAAQSLEPGPVDGDTFLPGGINAAEPAGQAVPEIGIPVSVEIIGQSESAANLIVRFLVGEIEVHRTEWRVPAGESRKTIGPELATRIEVTGSFTDGTPTPILNLSADEDFAAGDVVEYIVPNLVPTAPGTITGLIRDAATGSPLAEATVTVYQGETVIATGITAPGGTFILQTPAGTGFQLVINNDGYLDETYSDIAVIEGQISNLPPIPQVQNVVTDPGGAEGRILNALDGNPVQGLMLRARRGINNSTGPVVAQTTTDSNGGYSLSGLAPGVYTGEVSGGGFITSYFTIVVIGGTVSGDQNTSVTPVLLEGQTRIVLTWGASPSDLDSHLTGPTVEGGRFRVYFGNKIHSSGEIIDAELDLDDVSSFGPETTTLSQQIEGVYRFLVHDFSNGGSTSSTALSASGATVQVFQGSSLIATFSVPADQGGTLWTVFELQGNVITPVNALSFAFPSNSSRTTGTQDPEAALFRDLPEK